MQHTCIVTDASAQFPKRRIGVQNLVKILPLMFTDNNSELSFAEDNLHHPDAALSLPTELSILSSDKDDESKLKHYLTGMAYEFQQVLFLLPTKTFFPSFSLITQTLQQMNLPSVFNIIDSHSLGYGLGWLIQTCAAVVGRYDNISDVKRFLHHKIPHIYTLLYLPDLSNLSRSKILDPDQAFVGGLLGIRPLILLENDQIIPYQKTRNFKNLVDSMVEYAHEFDRIEYIGLHFGRSVTLAERKTIQNRLQPILPQNPIDAQVMSPYLNHILGDQAICMILIESANKYEI